MDLLFFIHMSRKLAGTSPVPMILQKNMGQLSLVPLLESMLEDLVAMWHWYLPLSLGNLK